MLTQCPRCDATFNVTESQLELAVGKVRCGACMEVFQADDNFVEIAEHKDEKTDYQNDYSADDGEFDVIEDADDDFDTDFGKLKVSSRPQPNTDYSYIDDGSDDDSDDELSADDFDTDEILSTENDQFDKRMVNRDDTSPADEGWAEELLRDSDGQRSDQATVEVKRGRLPRPGQIAGKADGQVSAGGALDTLRAERITIRGYYSTAGVDRGVYWRPIAGGAFALLLVLALIAQLAWLHFDKLAARVPGLIPYYQSICSLLDCTVPSLYDLDMIKSQDLVVRAHPVAPDALIVDCILINTADFGQPYPDILLRFSDASDTLIASRRFTPEEYYPDRSREDAFMPPNAPVKIVLEIRDPGRAAVNYRLDFRPSIEYRSAASAGDKLSNSGL